MQVGEQLACAGLLLFGGEPCLSLVSPSGTGAAATTAWLRSHLNRSLIVLPVLEKEQALAWHDCR